MSIFISYRREGGEIMAQLLHDRLKQKGFTVFYDIESLRSGPFNEKLYKEIEQCTDFLLVLPSNGLDRCVYAEDWVRKEIAYALKCNKNVVPVMLRGFSFPSKLPKEIEQIRWQNGISFETMDCFNAKIDKLIEMLGDQDTSDCTDIDSELMQTFASLFAENESATSELDRESPLQKKLKARTAQKLFSFIQQNAGNPPSKDKPISITSTPKSVTISITTPRNVVSLLYVIYEDSLYDYTTLTASTGALPAAKEEKQTSKGDLCTTFTCTNLDSDGNSCLLFSFIPSQNSVVITPGLIENNKCSLLTANPIIQSYSQNNGIISAKDFGKYQLCDEQEEYAWCDASMSAHAIIIDPVCGLPVLREIYYDEKQSKYRARIKLRRTGSYLAFELAGADEPRKMTSYELGLCYKYGSFGFPKDVVKALECFESANSGPALYEAALIYRDDDLLSDETDFLSSLSKAAEAGYDKAKTLLQTVSG